MNQQYGYGSDVSIERSLGRGWNLFKEDAGPLVGYTILVTIISAVLGGTGKMSPGWSPVPGLHVGLTHTFQMLLMPPLTAGWFLFVFRRLRGESASFETFFSGFSFFLSSIIANFLTVVLVVIGFVLLIVPGVYILIMLIFVFPALVDRSLNAVDAMRFSRDLVKGNWGSCFLLCLTLLGINILGAIPCGLGLLITVPLSVCTLAAYYEDLTRAKGM